MKGRPAAIAIAGATRSGLCRTQCPSGFQRTIFITDAHRCDGKRFVVQADEKLTAPMELELASRVSGQILSKI
jgi:hypothetical protein